MQPDLGGTGGSTSEFLVRMENLLPASFPADERAQLLQAEAVRSRELASAGILIRLWRVADRRANAGIWRGDDRGIARCAGIATAVPLSGYRSNPAQPASQ